eukprot:jgi/Chlat1/8910/Chrsp92S08227
MEASEVKPGVVTGGCMCRQVQVEVDAKGAYVGFCHCKDCRASSGEPFHAFVGLPMKQISVVKGEDLLRAYNHTPKTKRCFCSNCGTNVVTYVASFDWASVPRGVLSGGDSERLAALKPSFQVFLSEAEDWYAVSDDMPKFPKFPTSYDGLANA